MERVSDVIRLKGHGVYGIGKDASMREAAKAFLDKEVPEAKASVVHGQMPPAVLEDVMSAFYDG